MDTKSNTEPLAPVTFDEFAPTSYETWKAAAIESLKGNPAAGSKMAGS